MNAGKLGITLDLHRPEARAVFLDLVRWADVLVESFSPKAMRSWDLGYERLREVNPGLIYLSASMAGAYGPQRGWRRATGPTTTGTAAS